MGGFCLFFCCHNLYRIKSRKQQERPKGYGFCKLIIARLNRKKQNTPIWQTHKKIKNAKRLRVLHAEHSSPQPKTAKHAYMADSQKKQQERPKGYGFCKPIIARLNRKKQNPPIWQTHKKHQEQPKGYGFCKPIIARHNRKQQNPPIWRDFEFNLVSLYEFRSIKIRR